MCDSRMVSKGDAVDDLRHLLVGEARVVARVLGPDEPVRARVVEPLDLERQILGLRPE